MERDSKTHSMRGISSIKGGRRHRQDPGDLGALTISIQEVGLMHPIVITDDGQLIAGERRLLACKRLGWNKIPVHVVPLKDIALGELHENTVRKAFTPSEAVAITRTLAPVERKKAKKRQGHSGPRSGKLPERTKGTTRDQLAVYVGMSGRTLEKAEEVVQAAEKNPEDFEFLVSEMDRTGRVDGVHKKLQTLQQATQSSQQEAKKSAQSKPKKKRSGKGKSSSKKPDDPGSEATGDSTEMEAAEGEEGAFLVDEELVGPFGVIVADLPWPTTSKRGETYRSSIEQLCSVRVSGRQIKDTVEKDAVLLLWTTNECLPEALQVIEAWGFNYKTMLTWVQAEAGDGDYLWNRTEHCLLAVRGRPTVSRGSATTVLISETGFDTYRPDSFYELVEGLRPGQKAELFGTKEREGWADLRGAADYSELSTTDSHTPRSS